MNRCAGCGLLTSGIAKGGECAECEAFHAVTDLRRPLVDAREKVLALAKADARYRVAVAALDESLNRISEALEALV